MKRYLIFVGIALVVSLGSFFPYRSGFPFIEQVDLRLKDARFLMRGAIKPGPQVAVVAIDGKSVKELGRWPWSREVTARLLDSIAESGARIAALDIVFSEPQGARPDRELARAVADSGRTIMGYFFRDEVGQVDAQALEQLAGARVKLVKMDPGVTSVPLKEYAGVDPNIAQVAAGAAGFGFFNQVQDDDGLFRKTPLLLLYNGDIYPSLGLTALARYLGQEIVVDLAGFGVRSVSLGPLFFPVSEQGLLSLNYYGAGGSFPTFSASDVMAGRLPPGALKEKLVFVGVTETGIYDLRATPFDGKLPGVEIHATLAANALERAYLIRDGRTVGGEIACLFIIPIVLALLLARASRTWMGLGYFLLCSLGYVALNYLLFSRYCLDLSLVFPLTPVLFTYIGAEAYRNVVIEKRGRYLRKAFASYVAPELVAEILKNPDRLRLGGEKREITVLFSDIRGFTTLSESLAPEELVSLLNAYLSPMTRIVLEEKGTLDKYLGDAIMALFNAPLNLDGHATHACRSACRMIERLKELNAEFARQGMPQIEIGIGINTGEAVVGNMGADTRFDYTAIGDSVNLASRLEGLNKLYGTRILVTEMTRAEAGEGFTFREVDLVRVKGKLEPVAVFEIMTEKEELAPRFAEGLALYRSGDFCGARKIFAELAEGAGDRVSLIYVERCSAYAECPPSTGWDGVYVALSK